jgi:hypothetical protein
MNDAYTGMLKRLEKHRKMIKEMNIPSPYEPDLKVFSKEKIKFREDRNWPSHLLRLVRILNADNISDKEKMKECLRYISWSNCSEKSLIIRYSEAKTIIEKYINWAKKFGK